MFSDVKHFTYEAAVHCVAHAVERFGEEALSDGSAEDNEGNPVSACMSWDECDEDYCDECVYAEVSARWLEEEQASRC
jgi:hypothetical protein